MPSRDLSCSFTGHRPSKLPWGNNESDPRCIELKKKLRDLVEAVYHGGIRHYICGMARGCDFYFCEAVIDFRKQHPDVTLEAAIPCETQAAKWNDLDRNRYYRLVEQCDIETMVQRNYSYKCMTLRNKYMVDNSSVLIAAFNGSMGGTMQTIIYAKSKNLEIIQITP